MDVVHRSICLLSRIAGGELVSVYRRLFTRIPFYLPPQAKASQGFLFLVSSFGEQLAIHHRVKKPVPVFLGHVRDKPRVPFTMEPNLVRKSALNEEVGFWPHHYLVALAGKNQTYHKHSHSTIQNLHCQGRNRL